VIFNIRTNPAVDRSVLDHRRFW